MTTTVQRRTRVASRSANRVLWITFGSVFAVACLVYGTFTVVELVGFARSSSHVVITPEQAAGITRIEVRSDAGSARIIGSDRTDIVVDGKITYGLKKPGDSTRIEGDTLVVDSSCEVWVNTFCTVDYTIQVPARLEVEASASGGGLRIEGIDGSVKASSSGGGVRAVDTGGDLDLDSSGGGVRGERLRSQVVVADSSGGGVRLSFAEPPRTVDADSSGGGVTIEVPPGVAFDIRASSSGGGVDTSDVAHDPDSDRTITVDSSGGGVTVRRTE
jgi:hypothetical protein